MSDKNKLQASKNLAEWKETVSKKQIKHYEYKDFSNIDKIDNGAFGKVYHANWKNEQYLALKLFKFDKTTVKEIIHEVITKYDIYLSLFNFKSFTFII